MPSSLTKLFSLHTHLYMHLMQYVSFRSETSVTIMICVVWFLSALVSLPTLLYPPWRIPFEKPTGSKIYFQQADKLFLDALNVTQELAYQRCSVSIFSALYL